MGVRIEKVDLPGIGVRHDVVTAEGRRVAVVSHRNGARDIALFDPDDPDASTESVPLTEEEAAALANVLGASVMMQQLAGIRDQAAGLFTEQISLPADSPYVSSPLGRTRARTRTGASIVAILRGHEVIPSPTPDVVFQPSDTLVAVGTRKGLDALSTLLAHGPS
ncbi:cation:proton antiporter regulatory subunit [Lysobacter korlensis]|uniref:Cation:proton antiporter regulatory subunit n=1 Tax=Lysobacter korlensis TaxID=553636 RepID=A0ABV6RNW4_9GAMM